MQLEMGKSKMGDHILPQVLLRGFSLNKNDARNKQKIMVYDREKCKVSRISTLYQQNTFYSREIESHLQKEYETPFGELKMDMEKELLENYSETYLISKEKLLLLIRFFVVMWRRNDVQLDKAKATIEKIVNYPGMREKMIPKFKNMTVNQLISMNEKRAQHDFYDKVILQTTNEDPTVLKTYINYLPVIIINKTNINFPLHNKYASIQYVYSNIKDYPDFTIEPINNRIYMLFVLNKQHKKNSDMNAIKVIYLDSVFEIELLIRMYIIDTLKTIVVDESNIEIVKDKLTNKQTVKISLRDVKVQKFLDKIGLLMNN